MVRNAAIYGSQIHTTCRGASGLALPGHVSNLAVQQSRGLGMFGMIKEGLRCVRMSASAVHVKEIKSRIVFADLR